MTPGTESASLTDKFKRIFTVQFALIIGTIIVCRLLAAYVFSTFDDAFITYRYGANLARGHGLVYNVNEKVLGTTAPLFAIVCSIPAILSLSIPKFILLFNISCDLFSFYLIERFFLGKNSIKSLVFGILFALDPSTNRISVGGMEANLFLLCSIVVIVLFVKKRKFPAYSLAAIIYLLRPEALVLWVLLILSDWRRSKVFPVKPLLLCGAIMIVPLSSILLYYGQILPQSVIARNQFSANSISSLIHSVFFLHPFSFVIFPLAVYGSVLAFRMGTALRLLIFWTFTYAAAYLIRGPWVMNWYIYSIAVSELVLAGIAVSALASRFKPNPANLKLVTFCAFASVSIWSFGALRLGRSGVETNVFSALKRDFANNQNNNTVFFADDIGALGFYTGGYIYDNVMLVTPQAANFRNAEERIENLWPDYLFLYVDHYYLAMIRNNKKIASAYTFIKRYSRYGEKNEPSDKEGSGGYKQDFVLMKRNTSR